MFTDPLEKKPIFDDASLIRIHKNEFHPLRKLLGYTQSILLLCCIDESAKTASLGQKTKRNVLFVGSEMEKSPKICLFEDDTNEVGILT
jgi:hypothetical protein